MLDLSCTDWRDRLRDGRSLVPDLQLPDPAAGERAVAVFNRLRLADVPGTPTMSRPLGVGKPYSCAFRPKASLRSVSQSLPGSRRRDSV